MRTTVKPIAVDSKKLKTEFHKRRLTCAKIAKDMGRSEKYLSNKLVTERGLLYPWDIGFIEKIYDIKVPLYEESKNDVPVESKKNTANVIQPVRVMSPVSAVLNEEQLYRIIYTATLEAMKKALAGDNENGEK